MFYGFTCLLDYKMKRGGWVVIEDFYFILFLF